MPTLSKRRVIQLTNFRYFNFGDCHSPSSQVGGLEFQSNLCFFATSTFNRRVGRTTSLLIIASLSMKSKFYCGFIITIPVNIYVWRASRLIENPLEKFSLLVPWENEMNTLPYNSRFLLFRALSFLSNTVFKQFNHEAVNWISLTMKWPWVSHSHSTVLEKSFISLSKRISSALGIASTKGAGFHEDKMSVIYCFSKLHRETRYILAPSTLSSTNISFFFFMVIMFLKRTTFVENEFIEGDFLYYEYAIKKWDIVIDKQIQVISGVVDQFNP